MSTDVVRLLPTEEADALLELTRDLATRELAPQVAEAEERAEFPEAAYRLLGKSGLLSLPFAEEHGGGGQPYEVCLQVVEEIATAWPSVGVGTSVHSLTAGVVAANATQEQQAEWLPRMLGGDWLGGYCLSEPQAGSDVSAIRTRAVRDDSLTTGSTSSTAPSSGSATAPAPTTTSSSPGPARTPVAGSRPSSSRTGPRGCRSERPRRRWASPATSPPR